MSAQVLHLATVSTIKWQELGKHESLTSKFFSLSQGSEPASLTTFWDASSCTEVEKQYQLKASISLQSIKLKKKFQETAEENSRSKNYQGIVLGQEWSVSTWIKQLSTNIADISRRVAFICSLISCLLVCYWLFIGSEWAAGWGIMSRALGRKGAPTMLLIPNSISDYLPPLPTLSFTDSPGKQGNSGWGWPHFRASSVSSSWSLLAFIAHRWHRCLWLLQVSAHACERNKGLLTWSPFGSVWGIEQSKKKTHSCPFHWSNSFVYNLPFSVTLWVFTYVI